MTYTVKPSDCSQPVSRHIEAPIKGSIGAIAESALFSRAFPYSSAMLDKMASAANNLRRIMNRPENEWKYISLNFYSSQSRKINSFVRQDKTFLFQCNESLWNMSNCLPSCIDPFIKTVYLQQHSDINILFFNCKWLFSFQFHCTGAQTFCHSSIVGFVVILTLTTQVEMVSVEKQNVQKQVHNWHPTKPSNSASERSLDGPARIFIRLLNGFQNRKLLYWETCKFVPDKKW